MVIQSALLKEGLVFFWRIYNRASLFRLLRFNYVTWIELNDVYVAENKLENATSYEHIHQNGKILSEYNN